MPGNREAVICGAGGADCFVVAHGAGGPRLEAGRDRAGRLIVCQQAMVGAGRVGAGGGGASGADRRLPGDALTNTAEVNTPTDSKRADQLLAERLGSRAEPTEVVVVRSLTLTANEPAFQDQLQRLRQAALATGVLDATAVAAVGAEDLPVSPTATPCWCRALRADTDEIEPLVELVGAADGQGGFDVELVGEATADRDFEELSGQDLREGELLFGLPPRWWSCCWCSARCWRGWSRCCWRWCRSWSPWRWPHLVGQGRAVAVRGQHDHRDGPGPGDRLRPVHPVALREERAGAGPRLDAIGTAGDRQPGGAVQRPGLCPGHGGHGAGARHHPAQPGGRGDPGRRGLGGGGADPAAGAAGVARRPRQRPPAPDRGRGLAVPAVSRGAWSRVVQGGGRPAGPGPVVSAGLPLALAVPVLDLERGFAGVSTLPDRFPSKQGLVALEASFPGATTEPAKVVIDGQVTTPQVRARSSGCAATWTAAAPSGRPRWRPTRRGSWRCWRCRWAPTPKAPPPTPRSASSATSSFPRRSRGWRPRCWSPATPPRTSTTSPSSDAGSAGLCWSSCSA